MIREMLGVRGRSTDESLSFSESGDGIERVEREHGEGQQQSSRESSAESADKASVVDELMIRHVAREGSGECNFEMHFAPWLHPDRVFRLSNQRRSKHQLISVSCDSLARPIRRIENVRTNYQNHSDGIAGLRDDVQN